MTVEFARGKSYVVDRGKPKTRAGQGMLAGLDVVIRHFFGAFSKKIETPADTTGVFTVQYPEERLALPQAFRNFPILLYDDATGHELCTSCFQCERICPPQVIHMTQATDPTTGKPIPAVKEFMIEYDACMSCGLCAEVCPFDAIKMDHEFELATSDHPSMTVDKAGLDRPISYYQTIAPRFWEEAKDSALKKLQGNMKRRSGNIGITPSRIGKAQKPAPAASRPAAAGAAAPAAASKPKAPVAAVGKNMSEEKLARLAAIRAANAAKSGGDAAPAGPPVELDTPEADGAEPAVAVADAPVAAARTAPSGGLPFSADNILGGVPANTAMAEDKVERLRSIRSGNLAKNG